MNDRKFADALCRKHCGEESRSWCAAGRRWASACRAHTGRNGDRAPTIRHAVEILPIAVALIPDVQVVRDIGSQVVIEPDLTAATAEAVVVSCVDSVTDRTAARGL